jgi:hypothetical protein
MPKRNAGEFRRAACERLLAGEKAGLWRRNSGFLRELSTDGRVRRRKDQLGPDTRTRSFLRCHSSEHPLGRCLFMLT